MSLNRLLKMNAYRILSVLYVLSFLVIIGLNIYESRIMGFQPSTYYSSVQMFFIFVVFYAVGILIGVSYFYDSELVPDFIKKISLIFSFTLFVFLLFGISVNESISFALMIQRPFYFLNMTSKAILHLSVDTITSFFFIPSAIAGTVAGFLWASKRKIKELQKRTRSRIE